MSANTNSTTTLQTIGNREVMAEDGTTDRWAPAPVTPAVAIGRAPRAAR
jgi:hypothetical protein